MKKSQRTNRSLKRSTARGRLVLAALLALWTFAGASAQENVRSAVRPELRSADKVAVVPNNAKASKTRPSSTRTPAKTATKASNAPVRNNTSQTGNGAPPSVRVRPRSQQEIKQRRLDAVARAERDANRNEKARSVSGSGTVPTERARRSPLVWVLLIALYIIVALVVLYALRHYWFTINRLVGKQRHPYIDIDTASWPPVTVFIAAHNEEAVIDQILDALLQVDYPADKLRIVPVNDRSTDRTKEIIDEWVVRYPGRIEPFHREGGAPGKAAALKDATELTNDDLIIVFDADYIPGRGLVKQLVSPFFDPEVGAVMGRVVPWNVGSNLLARLLDLERSGGYQVDQQARMNMKLVPQYGGTVGGVRKSALESVGGWRTDSLSEDTDMTYKMLLAGWKTVYQNRSECYEEVPEVWQVRIRQIMRWAKGHNQAWARYWWPLVWSRNVSWRERLDGLLLLGVFLMSPLVLIGWMLALTLFYMGENPYLGALAVLAVASYSALGNFAAFFEIAAAGRLDGYRRRIRLLPLNSLGFLVSLVSTSRAAIEQVSPSHRRRAFQWDKTERFRTPTHHGIIPAPERDGVNAIQTPSNLTDATEASGEAILSPFESSGAVSNRVEANGVVSNARDKVSL